MTSHRRELAPVALAMCTILLAAASSSSGEKIKVASLDDLPRHSYPLAINVSDLIACDEAFAGFAAKVRSDIEADLERYEIHDAATLQRMYTGLHRLHMIAGDHAEAMQWLARATTLEAKESLRLTSDLIPGTIVAARVEVGDGAADEDFRAAFAKHLAARVACLPWDRVQDQIEQIKGRTEVYSENMVLGLAATRMDPVVAQSGEVSSELAADVVTLRYRLAVTVPLRDELVEVLGRAIEANRVVKPDIWPARSVTLDESLDLTPVFVGIWDSGVDTEVFPGSLWVNANEVADGSDSDGNGFVDDVHGIAFDLDGQPTPELLHPEGDMAGRVDETIGHMKGYFDIQASIDSPEASALKRHLASLEPEQVKAFIEGLGFCSLYLHGTHVAGIALDGNPFARALVARITFDYHSIPQPLTVEIARRHARSYMDTVRYFSEHGVRVVNMSWGWTLKEVEGILENSGAVSDADERTRLTREIFGILRDGMREAIAGAPQILFVNAAGNEDSDVAFDAVIPGSFDLPNLLTVGAVDQAGEATSFTSTGRNVVLYANGFEVESFIPGGGRMAASGTSQASPNATNLVAKLIALEPKLTPAEVIELMIRAGDRHGEGSELLMNPKRAVEMLRQDRAS